MALGFEPTKKTIKKVEEPVIDDINIEYEQEEKVVSKPKATKPPVRRTGPVTVEKKKNNNTTIIIACGAVVAVLLGILIIVLVTSGDDTPPPVEEPVIETPITTEEDNVNVGLPNLNVNTNDQNVASVTDNSLILKDINGNMVDTNYTVRAIDTVTDFISYEKHRAVLSNGLEYYWLEASYKDKPYKVQVSYQIFKELDKKGITVVDVEVLTLENGEKMVTYMKVRSDYKRLLEGN